MSFTVITVNFNNEIGLKRTIHNIDSVRAITNGSVELIVIDGFSSDKSFKVLEDYNNKVDKWISEKDDGIFDAMNKGINLASNDWLIFMNSGDIFYKKDILNRFISQNINESVGYVYGDKIENGKISSAEDVRLLKFGIIHACHQSMFFRRSLKIKYDKDCKIYGDYGYVVDHEFAEENTSFYLREIISQTEPDGIGAKKSFRKRYEKYRLVFMKFGFFYLLLSLLFRSGLQFKKIIGSIRNIGVPR